MTKPSPFKKNVMPKNSLELLRWVIFEPVIFESFSNELTKRKTVIWFLKAYAWVILFSLILYIVGVSIVVIADLPSHFPTQYKDAFITQWQNNSDFASKWYFVVSSDYFRYLRGLALGLTLGLTLGLAVGLVFGLVFGLAVGLAVGLAFGVAVGLALSLALGLALGLAFGLVVGLVVGLGGDLGGALAVGLAGGLAGGLANSLVFTFSFFLFYIRLIFYPYHFVKSAFKLDFYHNPYLNDGLIYLPIWGVKSKLTQLAQQQPELAIEFVKFLLEYRPLQRTLAMHILHAAIAGIWIKNPLNADKLSSPSVAKEVKKLIPSKNWIQQLKALRIQLVSYEQQNNIHLQKEFFKRFIELLKEFRTETLLESPRWHRYYLNAIDKWLTIADEKFFGIQQEAKNQEPITPNLYRSGDALIPETDGDIFIGRDDLKRQLATDILTARTMPLFLIQGQRRVGKTSLLNFLPQLLGSRFKIVCQDCQDSRVDSVIHWMQYLRELTNKELGLPQESWQPPDNWLKAWQQLQGYLENISRYTDSKIILALDEYETLHGYFQENEKEAKRLLGAMRSFCQHQNQVVFLFVGAALLSELHAPNWSEYFVQVRRLKVDYLTKADAIRLITEPVALNYPLFVVEKMFKLTQGHPALLQALCQKMVNIANHNVRRNMTKEDLDQAIVEMIDRETLALTVFWTQFCRSEKCKATVKEILANQVPTHKASFLRLKEHGYIEKREETWKMRVPLFEMWLREYADAFE